MKNKKILVGIISVIGISIIGLVTFLIVRKPTYEVSFNVGDNKLLKTENVSKNETITEPTNPTKEGYTFVGWYYNGKPFDFTTKITEDIELVAKWVKENAILYSVKFNTDGGEKIESIQVEKNTAIGKLPIPSRNNYNFIGWYLDNKLIDENTIVTKNMTLVAKWEIVESTTTKKTTTKKATTKKATTKTTTTRAATTTKAPTTTTTTTKAATTTTPSAVLSYKLESSGSVVGQVMLYLTKNGEKVAGTCDIVTTTGDTITNVSISKTGYVTNDGLIDTVKNIRVN